LKVGGKVRFDAAYTPSQNQIAQRLQAQASSSGSNFAAGWTNGAIAASNETTTGYEARANVTLDARTQTSYGTLQTFVNMRETSQTGVLAQAGLDAKEAQSTQVEAAYIRFAGITAGRASEITTFMPNNYFFTAGNHLATYANGATQFGYTAILGGGLSATIGIEDPSSFSNSAVGFDGIGGPQLAYLTGIGGTEGYRMTLPVLAGQVRLDQSWGSAGVAGAVINNNVTQSPGVTATANVQNTISGATGSSLSATGWAAMANLKINLPMLAAGDELWLTTGYTRGFLDEILAYSNFKGSDTKNFVGGVIYTPASVYAFGTGTGASASTAAGTTGTLTSLEQTAAWNVAGILKHNWNDQWRSNLGISYASILPGTQTQATPYEAVPSGAITNTAGGGLQKMQYTSVAANLIWSPVANFDIGLEALYQNVHQNYLASDVAALTTQLGAAPKSNYSNVEGRVRLERAF